MSYRCKDYQGYIYGNNTGRRYKLIPGKILDAPNGDLWNYYEVEWIGDEPEKQPEPIEPSVETIHPKPLDGTKKEIKKWLDDHDIEYKSNALKDELLEILEDA